MTGTSVVDIKAELARQAALTKDKTEQTKSNIIKVLKNKRFRLPTGEESEGPMKVVIVDFLSQNVFFDRPYKEGDVIPPSCIAIGSNPRTLKPSDKSPAKEAEECAKCPNNEFGSKGNGKACSNTRLVAVVQPNDDPTAPILILRVSATGLKSFDGYVTTLSSRFESVPVAFETEIYFDPDLDYPSLRFGNPTPNANVGVHITRQKEANDLLNTLPDMSSWTPPPKKPAKK